MEKKSLLPWRLIKRNGLINTIFKVPWRRFLMQRNIDKINMEIPDTVSVVIGVKNRNDHKLRNTLWSIRNQDYPENLVEILIVDYESNITAKKAAEKLALEFKALFIPLTNTVGWNKSKCYNYGIKKASGKFIVSCDADIIFEKNYFDEMIKKLKKNPLSVIYSQMMDLPESSNDFVVTYCNDNTEIPYDFLYKLTTPRSSGDIHPGTNATYKYIYHLINGYDEFYNGWGLEDNDLQSRFYWLGLDMISLTRSSSYMHQWHPKGAGIDNFDELYKINLEYYNKQKTVIRNLKSWGEL